LWRTVQLGVVVDCCADADHDSVVHGAHPMGHDHTVSSTENQLLAMFARDLGIQRLGKGECEVWPVRRGAVAEVGEGGGQESGGRHGSDAPRGVSAVTSIARRCECSCPPLFAPSQAGAVSSYLPCIVRPALGDGSWHT
jgi:hypothetical protein